MNKISKLLLCAVLCLFLCSCENAGTTEKAENIGLEYAKCSEFGVRAEITADYGEHVLEYDMKYSGSASQGVIEIFAPKSIAGLKVQAATAEKTKLIYDGAELWAGELSKNGLDPVSSLPVMINQWRGGYVESSIVERLDGGTYLAVIHSIDDSTRLLTWFDMETHLPYKAEISSDSRTVIRAVFKNVTTL